MIIYDATVRNGNYFIIIRFSIIIDAILNEIKIRSKKQKF